MADALRIDVTSPEQLRDELNRAGVLAGGVEVACVLRQGHSPSIAGAILLYGLVKLLAPGRRELPRTFVLAATAERVAALGARGNVRGENLYRLTVNASEDAGWPRERVRIEAAKAGITANAFLLVPGEGAEERIACSVPNSQLEPALELMSGALAG